MITLSLEDVISLILLVGFSALGVIASVIGKIKKGDKE